MDEHRVGVRFFRIVLDINHTDVLFGIEMSRQATSARAVDAFEFTLRGVELDTEDSMIAHFLQCIVLEYCHIAHDAKVGRGQRK